MKQIKIDHSCIIRPDKKHWNTLVTRLHRVYLYPDFCISFTVGREAEAFISRVNGFLNIKLIELNEIYIDLFTQYRRAWFYFEDNKTEATIISRHLTDINKGFDFITEKGFLENYSFHVFNWFDLITKHLINIIETLQEVHKRHNHYSEMKILEAGRSRIEFIRYKIFDFGPEYKNSKEGYEL